MFQSLNKQKKELTSRQDYFALYCFRGYEAAQDAGKAQQTELSKSLYRGLPYPWHEPEALFQQVKTLNHSDVRKSKISIQQSIVTFGGRPLLLSCESPWSFSIKGIAKENVFPVPVRAWAITSFPAYTGLKVFTCTGNRYVTPRAVQISTDVLNTIVLQVFLHTLQRKLSQADFHQL